MDTENEVITAESGTVALLNRSEIDMQIATAHKYPRSLARFTKEALAMVAMSEEVAEECVYALPRKEKDKETGQFVTKTIEGPSARFAEIVVSAWGNSRAGARVVSDEGEFVTAQGVMHDLERNVAITYEVQRRIVDSRGNRYKADMIGVTANAASSIALRNAILKVIPKAFWNPIYKKAREVIMGDFATLDNRRSDALKAFQKFGVEPTTIYAYFEIGGIEDITLEHLVTLRGLLTALREGDSTPEQMFAKEGAPAGAKPAVSMPKARPAAAAGIPEGTAAGSTAPAATGGEGLPFDAAPPAASPAPGPKPAGNTALATDGERQLIVKRARSAGMELAVLMEQAGIRGLPADLAGLTKDGFIALRDALPKN